MGDEYFILPLGPKDYTAAELSSLILKKLKKDAEKELGDSIGDAVITVPAYFKEKERKATIEAGKLAGLSVLQVINEPTAAAVAYGLKQGDKEQTILVYDLGGGTFDVTVMKIDSSSINVLNSVGDHQLGGKDWDEKIITYIANEFKDEFGEDPLEDSESIADLMVRVEDAKKKLSSVAKTKIAISYEGMKGRYELDRETFENVTADLMERTVFLVEKALEDIDMSVNDIDGILLVGGSTRMPMVHRYIKDRFGKEPLIGVNVDEAVALGAAIVAHEQNTVKTGRSEGAYLPGMKVVKDVTNHSLGMIAINEDNTKYVNSFILPKNREIPCTEKREFSQRVGKKIENMMEIFVTQGEQRSPDAVDYLGRYAVYDIPYQDGGVATIDIFYTYDLSGTVDVKARMNGEELKVVKEALPDDIPERFMKVPELELIEAEPEFTTVYLAFDISGSMLGKPLREAKKAAHGFVRNMDLNHSAIGLIIFSDRTQIILDATQNTSFLNHAIEDIRCCSTGMRNGANTFPDLLNLLKNQEGRKYSVVLADGVWRYQDQAVMEAEKCHKEDIEVVAIGFGKADYRFLQKIASAEEGSILTTVDRLVETFSNIAQEINNANK